MGGGQPSAPKVPSAGKEYKKATRLYLKFLPQLLAAEQQARSTYDPQRVEQDLAIQGKYGDQYTQQGLDQLNAIDPESQILRKQMMDNITRDLDAGYELGPDLERELEQYVRGGQTARGNYLGNAPISEEALFKGQRAIDLYNRRLAHAGTALGTPGPLQQLQQVQRVPVDRQSAYVNTSGSIGAQGQQTALGYYNAALQGAQMGGGQSGGGWSGALAGAGTGAAAGAMFGPWGAAIGGVAGGAIGYFSDVNVKENIVKVGESPRLKLPIYEFDYKGGKHRWRGVMAQDVLNVKPEAVSRRGAYFVVDYSKLDVKLERVREDA